MSPDFSSANLLIITAAISCFISSASQGFDNLIDRFLLMSVNSIKDKEKRRHVTGDSGLSLSIKQPNWQTLLKSINYNDSKTY